MLVLDGRTKPTRWQRWRLALARQLADRARIVVEVRDDAVPLRFACGNLQELRRAATLRTKESGTMAWLDANAREGDRFLDIGANIGLYTLAAARLVGSAGRCYAVEPHKFSAVSLMRNVMLSGFEDRVTVLATALTDRPTFRAFSYAELGSGSTGSQLETERRIGERPPESPIVECVAATSLDHLVAERAIEAPHLIKIDVDGIELEILRGMRALLASESRPRSIQVEVNPGEGGQIVSLMESMGYAVDHVHHTAAGQKRVARGVSLDEIPHNTVFKPR